MRVGDCIKVTRTFSKKDVNEFTDVSHDRCVHSLPAGPFHALSLTSFARRRNDWHVNEDKQGRLMAHGAPVSLHFAPLCSDETTPTSRHLRISFAGLLTTTMATVVGGMIGFMARQFTCEESG